MCLKTLTVSELEVEIAKNKNAVKRADAWRTIQSAVHRAYDLTGLRPGELSRVKWTDLKPSQRCLVIGNAKAGNAISRDLMSNSDATMKNPVRHVASAARSENLQHRARCQRSGSRRHEKGPPG
jgi:hypothetical protein